MSNTSNTSNTSRGRKESIVVAWLVRLFPREFRQRYGDGMRDLLHDQLTDARRRSGTPGVIKVWLSTLFGVPTAAIRAHRDALFPRTALRRERARCRDLLRHVAPARRGRGARDVHPGEKAGAARSNVGAAVGLTAAPGIEPVATHLAFARATLEVCR